MSECRLCPRSCAVLRGEAHGTCGGGEKAAVSRAAPHFGEEPCISGSRGSGTVFFSGCSLRCVFCQNMEISRECTGKELDSRQLAEVFLRLRDTGVHNINLVTPTHFTDVIVPALQTARLDIPVVWNSSGYEEASALARLEGLVQVYLPDFKYSDSRLAAEYSGAPDYPQKALAAIKEMHRQTGAFELDGDGLLRRGMLIRHLILPGAAENTLGVIDMIEDELKPREIMLSLMAQYTPTRETAEHPRLSRRVTREEYERCLSYFKLSQIENGYVQELSSATDEMVPSFDGTGV